MTRLSHKDIDCINADLEVYNNHLISATGHSLFEIGCHCWGVEPAVMIQLAKSYTVRVIPVTAGLGVITSFSDTVAGILQFLGFKAQASTLTDVTGISDAIELRVDGLFMADDATFISLDCALWEKIDNSVATGRMYATVMDLMAGDTVNKDVLVVGCGPVGSSAAAQLLSCGKNITLFDTRTEQAEALKKRLVEMFASRENLEQRISIASDGRACLERYDYIIDATPDSHLIADSYLTSSKKIAIPGVPPGLSEFGFEFLQSNVVHDKLELGVTGMAIGLLAQSVQKV